MRVRRLGVRRFRRAEAGHWVEVGGEWLLIVEHDGWRLSIARGDRAEVERIYQSMYPTVRGLRMEAMQRD